MKVFDSIEAYAALGRDSHVALGFFDGVHLGHRAVIRDCVGGKDGCEAVVLTFAESPSRTLKKSSAPLITDNARKARLLEELGVDAVIFADFLSVRELDAEAFVDRVLYQALRAKKVSCGYNYRFGKNGAGDTAVLSALCRDRGIDVSVCEPVSVNGLSVSSTLIRELLQRGEMAGAGRLLGYPYTICGTVGSGNHIGASLGYPTVNLTIGEGLAVPRHGVYASHIYAGGSVYGGATNIGVHPTVGAIPVPVCETFLLGYDGGELYGEDVVCEPLAFIRPERAFSSAEELREQIGRDIRIIKALL